MRNLDLFRRSQSTPTKSYVNPWSEFSGLQRAMDRLFEDSFGNDYERSLSNKLGNWNPSSEATETKTHYEFRFDLPGVSKDAVKIELHDNQLTVSGERKEEKSAESEDNKKHFTEMVYGSFYRSFTLPREVDAERAEAKYENGVLILKVPKTEQSKPRQISIK